MSKNGFTESLGKFVQNPYVVLFTYLLSIVSLLGVTDNFWLNISIYVFVAVYLITLTIYIIKRYFSVKKIKSNLTKKFYSDNKDLILMLSEFCSYVVESSLKVKKKKNIDYDYFRNILKNVCSIINKIVFKITGIEFSVCIKIFSQEELLETNYDNMSTITAARESKDYIKRSKLDNQKQLISNNTSFKTILDSGDLLWSCPDLTQVDPNVIAGSSYKNPDNDYRLYYNSTVVVPIRTKIENVDKSIIDYSSNSEFFGYHYLGFLCIDSEDVFNDVEVNNKGLYNVLILLGVALYPLLENYLVNEIERA